MALRIHTTKREIRFIRGLAESNPSRFFDYARVVLRNQRAYDPNIRVEQIKREIRVLIGWLRGIPEKG